MYYLIHTILSIIAIIDALNNNSICLFELMKQNIPQSVWLYKNIKAKYFCNSKYFKNPINLKQISHPRIRYIPVQATEQENTDHHTVYFRKNVLKLSHQFCSTKNCIRKLPKNVVVKQFQVFLWKLNFCLEKPRYCNHGTYFINFSFCDGNILFCDIFYFPFSGRENFRDSLFVFLCLLKNHIFMQTLRICFRLQMLLFIIILFGPLFCVAVEFKNQTQ